MSEKLSERLQTALLAAYHEAQDQSLTSAKLSEAQRLIDDEMKPLESSLAQAKGSIETLERMNQAVRRALDEAIPGWEGSGAGIVESIGMLAQAQADRRALRRAPLACPAVVPTNWLDPMLTELLSIATGQSITVAVQNVLLAVKAAIEEHVLSTLSKLLEEQADE